MENPENEFLIQDSILDISLFTLLYNGFKLKKNLNIEENNNITDFEGKLVVQKIEISRKNDPNIKYAKSLINNFKILSKYTDKLGSSYKITPIALKLLTEKKTNNIMQLQIFYNINQYNSKIMLPNINLDNHDKEEIYVKEFYDYFNSISSFPLKFNRSKELDMDFIQYKITQNNSNIIKIEFMEIDEDDNHDLYRHFNEPFSDLYNIEEHESKIILKNFEDNYFWNYYSMCKFMILFKHDDHVVDYINLIIEFSRNHYGIDSFEYLLAWLEKGKLLDNEEKSENFESFYSSFKLKLIQKISNEDNNELSINEILANNKINDEEKILLIKIYLNSVEDNVFEDEILINILKYLENKYVDKELIFRIYQMIIEQNSELDKKIVFQFIDFLNKFYLNNHRMMEGYFELEKVYRTEKKVLNRFTIYLNILELCNKYKYDYENIYKKYITKINVKHKKNLIRILQTLYITWVITREKYSYLKAVFKRKAIILDILLLYV